MIRGGPFKIQILGESMSGSYHIMVESNSFSRNSYKDPIKYSPMSPNWPNGFPTSSNTWYKEQSHNWSKGFITLMSHIHSLLTYQFLLVER